MTIKRNSNRMEKPVLALVLLSVFFYGVMVILTLLAKDIHDARLPQVTAGRLTKQSFSYTVTLEDGSTAERTGKSTAIPKELVDSGKIFTIRTVTENDITFYYAVQVSVSIDSTKNNDDYYAITTPGLQNEMFILTGYEELENGDEVFLAKSEAK